MKGVVIVVRECWVKARRRYAVYESCLATHSYDAVVSVSAVRHSADCESVLAATPGARCAVLWRESDRTTLPWLSSCRLVTFIPALVGPPCDLGRQTRVVSRPGIAHFKQSHGNRGDTPPGDRRCLGMVVNGSSLLRSLRYNSHRPHTPAYTCPSMHPSPRHSFDCRHLCWKVVRRFIRSNRQIEPPWPSKEFFSLARATLRARRLGHRKASDG